MKHVKLIIAFINHIKCKSPTVILYYHMYFLLFVLNMNKSFFKDTLFYQLNSH